MPTLSEATGPSRKVIGASIALRNIMEVFTIMFAPAGALIYVV